MGFSPFGIDSFVDKDRGLASWTRTTNWGKSYEVLQQLAPIIFQHEGRGEMAGFLLDKDHPQTTVELNGYRLDVRLDNDLRDGCPERIRVGHCRPVRKSSWAPERGSVFPSASRRPVRHTSASVRLMKEIFPNGVWLPGRRLNGDEDEQGKCWRFVPKRINIEKAVVYRYQ